MTKIHRLLVPLLSGVLLLAGTSTALANDPATPGCDDTGDAQGDVVCEQTGEQGATNEQGDKGETSQGGEQGSIVTGTGTTAHLDQQGENE